MSGHSATMCLVAWIPDRSGRCRSITTTSGRSAAAALTACAPLAASPTTSIPGSAARSVHTPKRNSGWSSTTRTRNRSVIGSPSVTPMAVVAKAGAGPDGSAVPPAAHHPARN